MKVLVVITLMAFCSAQVFADSSASLAEIYNIINGGSDKGDVITVEVHEVDSVSNIPAKQQLIPANFDQMHPPPHAGHAQWRQTASNSESHRSYTSHDHNNPLNSVLHKNRQGSHAHGGGYWGSSSYGLDNNAPQLTGPYTIVIVEETPSFQNTQNVGGLPNAYQQPIIYGQQEPNHNNRQSNYGQHQQNYGHQQPQYDNRHPTYWQQQPNHGHQQTNYAQQQPNYEQQQPNQDARQPSDENQKPNQHSNKHQHNVGLQESSRNNHQTDKQANTKKSGALPPKNQQDNFISNPASVAGPGPKPEINSTGRPLRENNVNQADTESNEFSIDIRTGFDRDYAKPKQ